MSTSSEPWAHKTHLNTLKGEQSQLQGSQKQPVDCSGDGRYTVHVSMRVCPTVCVCVIMRVSKYEVQAHALARCERRSMCVSQDCSAGDPPLNTQSRKITMYAAGRARWKLPARAATLPVTP
jgi:hypothetical protein